MAFASECGLGLSWNPKRSIKKLISNPVKALTENIKDVAGDTKKFIKDPVGVVSELTKDTVSDTMKVASVVAPIASVIPGPWQPFALVLGIGANVYTKYAQQAAAKKAAAKSQEEAGYWASEEEKLLAKAEAEDIRLAENRKKMLIWGAGGIALFLVLRKK